MLTVMKHVCDYWNLDVKETIKLSDRATLLLTTNEEKFVLKKKGKLHEAVNEFEILRYLNSNKIRVQLPLINKKGEFIATFNEETYCIYNYMDGATLSATDCLQDAGAPELLGETIASLHVVLNNSYIAKRFSEKDLFKTVYDFGVEDIFRVDSDEYLKSIFEYLVIPLKNCLQELPMQLIHRDLHISNIVYINNQLSAIIDFELVEINARIFDICYCSTSILSEIFNEISLREKWVSVVGKLVSSYSKINKLSEVEIKSMWYVMLAIQTIFMGYFTSFSGLYKINKEMFLWIYENRETIEKELDQVN